MSLNDITPEERRVLSRSIEYRNSVSLADAISRFKTESAEEVAAVKQQHVALQQRVVELEARVQALAAVALANRGPTSRS